MTAFLVGRLLFGVFARIPRPRSHYRASVDDETRDAIVEAERARVEIWASDRKLAERGIVIDHGCSGSSPRGVEITLPLRDLSSAPLLITARKRAAHVLDGLFDDMDLDGSLRAIAITCDAVRLHFLPLRATDVYDVALERLAEALRRDQPARGSRGIYR
jgi:hypothetical protein